MKVSSIARLLTPQNIAAVGTKLGNLEGKAVGLQASGQFTESARGSDIQAACNQPQSAGALQKARPAQPLTSDAIFGAGGERFVENLLDHVECANALLTGAAATAHVAETQAQLAAAKVRVARAKIAAGVPSEALQQTIARATQDAESARDAIKGLLAPMDAVLNHGMTAAGHLKANPPSHATLRAHREVTRALGLAQKFPEAIDQVRANLYLAHDTCESIKTA